MSNKSSLFLIALIIAGAAAGALWLAKKPVGGLSSEPSQSGAKMNPASDDPKILAKQAKGIIKSFAGKLKGELKAALKAGGPVNGIEVCQTAAPTVTSDVTDASNGWAVARTSLKLRNDSNEPDVFELKVLRDFEAAYKAGADPKKLVHKEIVDVDGKRVFRFVKAIPTGKVCLKCHGSTIKDDVRVKLKEIYPDDQATGFKLGDIRGAFSLSKELN